ncbi:MAG: hypothetical protein IAE89_07445 [Anaerolineae bacterium]|nr:hypothetical protein [Anaerolineae bacterium]
MIATNYLLHLRIVCVNPPENIIEGRAVEFGLQGKRDALIPGTHSDQKFVYSCEAEATLFNDTRVMREIRGATIHGKRDEPFLYISLRFEGSGDVWLRRWKIMFNSLTDQMITLSDGRIIETAIDLGHGSSQPRATFLEAWKVV